MDMDTYLAHRVHTLRKARGLTLEQLAQRSGVSRSMISLIERQTTSPTATVLNKLADALGLPLASLLSREDPQEARSPLSRQAEQALWTDPASGYQRRHLSPTGLPTPTELVEVHFPPHETVVFDPLLRQTSLHQQLWLLEGCMHITLGEQHWELAAGDCLAMHLQARIRFHNPGPQGARYLLALSSLSPDARSFS